MDNSIIGTVKTMTVFRKIDTGYVLKKDENEALLHRNEIDSELDLGQEIDVFLYQNKKGKIIATTTFPSIQIGTYDWAEVAGAISGLGTFVNIGINKEMLVSKDDLPLFEKVWPEAGDVLYVTLGKDRKDRLLAVPATENVFAGLRINAPDELLNKPFSGRVIRTSKEGSVVFSEEGYRGFIHHTERKQEPRLGELVHGRVIEVKGDGTLNISLRPLKQEGIANDAEAILSYLKEHDGVMFFSDKSDPEDIQGTFDVSKAAFKRALGRLMKDNKIQQRDGKTYLK